MLSFVSTQGRAAWAHAALAPTAPSPGACGWGPPDDDSIRAEAREEALFEAREEARDKLERVREELERVRKERDEAVAELGKMVTDLETPDGASDTHTRTHTHTHTQSLPT